MNAHRTLAAIALLIAITPLPAYAHTPAQARSIIRQEVRRAGGSAADAEAAVRIAFRESSWLDTARNGTCVGLFGLRLSMCVGPYRDWRDPAVNTRRAIRYMRGRYGTWTRAEAFWRAHHWW